MNGECALDADPERDLASGERFRQPAAAAPNDDALEHLHSLPLALHDPDVDPDGIAGTEVGVVVPQVRALDDVDRVHRNSS